MKRIFAKLDPSFFENRKVLRAGRNGREVFLFVICANANSGARGEIPAADLEPWYLSHRLGISEDEARDGVTRACDAGLIAVTDGRVTICGWDDDWSRLPKTDAQRAKEYRARSSQKEESSRSERDASRDDLRVTHQIRGEERREGARDAPGSLSGSSGSAPAPRPRKSAVVAQPLSSAWEPTADAADLARTLGLDLAHEAEQFKLNARARGNTYADADAAFAKFMRGSRDKGKTRPAKAGAVAATPRKPRVILNGQAYVEGADGELELAGDA